MTLQDIQIKENDVFHCRYTDSYRQKKAGWDLNHCFEGIVVAKAINEEIRLFDTFWGIGRTDNKSFKLNQISVDITIEYYCNLDEIERSKDAEKYYDDIDIFHLSCQHGCSESCRYTYIKKGATKNTDKMISVATEKIAEKESEIRRATSQIEWLKKDIEKIKSGDLNVYL